MSIDGSKYKLRERVNADIVRLDHVRYGAQVWTTGKIRGRAKPCEVCDERVTSGGVAFRPVTNGMNRMHRICDACVFTLPPAC